MYADVDEEDDERGLYRRLPDRKPEIPRSFCPHAEIQLAAEKQNKSLTTSMMDSDSERSESGMWFREKKDADMKYMVLPRNQVQQKVGDQSVSINVQCVEQQYRYVKNVKW